MTQKGPEIKEPIYKPFRALSSTGEKNESPWKDLHFHLGLRSYDEM